MLHLTWWQALALLVSAAVAVVGGRYLGRWLHRALYRLTLVTHTPHDDRIVLRLTAPLEVLAAVVLWEVLIGTFYLPHDAEGVALTAGRIGLLVALAWAALRIIDTVIDARFSSHVVSRVAMPIARRTAKVLVATTMLVMVLGALGFATEPLLVVLGVASVAGAVAARRPIENVVGAYAILSDRSVQEGDFVRLETGVCGTIEAIGIYSTRVRTADQSLVIIPNRRLAETQIETQRRPTRAHAAVPPPAAITYPEGEPS
jgi:MscS family membrane protein